jgi:uncharacterized membrane protein
MRWFILVGACLHVLFMMAELFPWPLPLLLRVASKKLPQGESFSAAQQRLVATIVHNAGIYNGIVAGGLLWAGFGEDGAAAVARVMFAGAIAAGVFGTVTLKSPVTAVQAVVGIVGLFVIR